MEKNDRPKVGLGVLILRNGKVLIGKRKNSHGDGTWCFPGGHLEFGETPEECARRETLEEAGITIKNIKRIGYTNDIFEKENKHYITLCMTAEYESGEIKIMEPDKFDEWKWFALDDLPKPLFISPRNLIGLYQTEVKKQI